MKRKFIKEGERGQAMVMATVFFVLISTTILLGLGTMISASQRLLSHSVLSEEALYLAESGAESAAYDIMHGTQAGAAPALYGTVPNVNVLVGGTDQMVSSAGTLQGVTRTIEVHIFASSTDSRIISWKEVR